MVFKKKETEKLSKQIVTRKGPPSIISSDLHVVGDIEGEGDLHIEGRVDGNIRCDQLTVGEQGQVKGKIAVMTLQLFGMVNGSVQAYTVKMMKTARMNGDVVHHKLEIESGAKVHGVYKQLRQEEFEKINKPLSNVNPADRTSTAIPLAPKSNETTNNTPTKKTELAPKSSNKKEGVAA